MALTIPNNSKPPQLLVRQQISGFCHPVEVFLLKKFTSTSLTYRNSPTHNSRLPQTTKNPFDFSKFLARSRCSTDGYNGEVFTSQEQPFTSSEVDTAKDTSFSANDCNIALYIRMLGLDNDPQDREEAAVTLWKYSLGGKSYIDNILKFDGTINLIVNLLKSDSVVACEAAAGLLQAISSICNYQDLVSESAVVEEMLYLLRRPSLSSAVMEQILCALWNLSVDEKLRGRMINSGILPFLVKFLDDEDLKVKEAICGLLANLALTHANHTIMVEAGVIPKLVTLLKPEFEGSKIIKKAARNALLELSKHEYSRVLVTEEGMILVPLVGLAAYKSFQPALHSWPSMPDGTKIEQASKGPSKFGASEMLIGLNIQENNIVLDAAKANAFIGRSHQQFLARVGAIETEEDSNDKFTLLPWIDGVARLILIIGLDDELGITRAARAIADASINEHIRVSFVEAGALKCLVN